MLGLSDVPCIRLAHLSDSQIRAVRLSDNKIAEDAGWDQELLAMEFHDLNSDGYDLSLTGFNDTEIAELMAPLGESGLTDPNEVPEAQEQIISKVGDLWTLGKNRLLCGDSTEKADVIRVMDGRRAKLFATDPPYLVDYDGMNHPSKYGEPSKNKDWSGSYAVTWDEQNENPDLYDGFISQAVENALADDAAWYCWHASKRHAFLESVWQKYGAFLHQQIIWVKDRTVLGRSIYMWQHEPCLFGWVKGKMPFWRKGEYFSTVWNVPTVKPGTNTKHPTSKPIELFTLPMQQHCDALEICYEPFCGSGSQIIAGEKTGRRVFAIEISPQYVDVSVRRWQEFTGERAVLLGDGRTFDEIVNDRVHSSP